MRWLASVCGSVGIELAWLAAVIIGLVFFGFLAIVTATSDLRKQNDRLLLENDRTENQLRWMEQDRDRWKERAER